MLRIFCGFDQREAIGWHVFAQSVIDRASQPISLTPLTARIVQNIHGRTQEDGTNNFTYSRFLIPEICGWAGWAVFVDACDMAMLGDICELESMCKGKQAVKVVKHDYRTKFPVKYQGTDMQSPNNDYPRKNWSSVILWNCGHIAHYKARHELRTQTGEYLHQFKWLKDEEIGEIPAEWNWLADEYGRNDKAKLLHWTAGIPGIKAYNRSPHAQLWQFTRAMVNESPKEIVT